MINQQKNNFNKRQVLNLSLIILTTLIVIALILWYSFKDFGKTSTNVENENKSNSSIQDTSGRTVMGKIKPSNLTGSYVGLRESIDGSVEAVLFQIEAINELDYSFTYVLNIGTKQKFSGIGKINIQKSLLISDMIGEMSYVIDSNGSVELLTPDSGSKAIYKLIREKQ